MLFAYLRAANTKHRHIGGLYLRSKNGSSELAEATDLSLSSNPATTSKLGDLGQVI